MGEMFKPLEKKAAPLQRALREFEALQQGHRQSSNAADSGQTGPTVRAPPGRVAARGTPLPQFWLRPPGALPEQQFRQTCSQCGDCVQVCPARCIRIEPDGRGGGFPFIDVDTMPCVLCDGLLCMHKCPTGALSPVPLEQIDMGTAVWHEETCARTRHEECTYCVDQCPVGEEAIRVVESRIEVRQDGCVGCGVCEHYCPTVPKSIRVKPRAARDGG